MKSRVKKNNRQREILLLMGILLAGLLVVPFAQLGQAQNMEGKIVIAPTDDYLNLMKGNPEMAREQLGEGIRIVNNTERPVRIRLFVAVVGESEIQRQHLSESAVTLEPGTSKLLARPKETFFPVSKLISGMNWVPTSTWVPNPEIFSGAFFARATANNPFFHEDLKRGVLAYDKSLSGDANINPISPILYLVALPTGELSENVKTFPLLIGGSDARVPGGNEWVPVDKRK